MNSVVRSRIVMVDDHAVVREGWRALLARQDDLELVGEAGDVDAAWVLCRDLQPDVVLVDLSLPGASGFALLERLGGNLPRCRPVVFSMHAQAGHIQRAFAAGAAAYVSKASSADELLTAVREAVRGRRYLSADVAQTYASAMLDGPDRVLERLSPREFEVLRMLVAGTSIDVISTALHLSRKTVMNHHYAIKRKLDVGSDIELVHLALRLALIDVPGGVSGETFSE